MLQKVRPDLRPEGVRAAELTPRERGLCVRLFNAVKGAIVYEPGAEEFVKMRIKREVMRKR